MLDDLTHHARTRQQERSVRADDLAAFHHWADEEEARRDGAVALKLSQQAAAKAMAAGASPAQAERLRRLVLIVKDGRVLTLYRRPACRRGGRPDQRRDGRRQLRARLSQWGRA